MNCKKIILVALLTSSFLGIFGCINCDDVLHYQEINGVTSQLLSNDFELVVEENTDLDSLMINVNFDIGFIASNINDDEVDNGFSFSLINQSYAWSCDEDGGWGLKDEIVSFKFYSSIDYLDIPAGSKIELENLQELTEEELIEKLNNYLVDFTVQLVEKQDGYFDLFVAFELASGKIQDFQLASFVWE